MHMNGARMRLIRMMLGYSMNEFITQMQKPWPQADRETVKRWENSTWEIPAEVAKHVEQLWENVKQKADAILEFLDEQIDAGTEPDVTTISIFATPESLQKAHPGIGWNQHTAQVGLLTFLLETEGFNVEINYAETEN